MSSHNAVSFTQVTKVFKDFTALDGITFTVPTGSIFGVVGTSGAGKSTLIRTVNGLETPSAGDVTVLGTPLAEANLRELRRRVSMVFQQYNLLSSKTVAENVAIPLVLAHVPKEEIQERVQQVLDLVGLTDRADHHPGQLSGGQQQRVAIARALITNPQLLLCDEPTSALDPITTKQILDLLVEINARLAVTILIITHQMDVIATIADHVAVLENGKLIEHGPVEQIFAQPKQRLTRDFVATVVPQQLPDTLVREVQARTWGTVLRIVYTDATGRDIISRLHSDFGITAELLHAVDTALRHASVGILVLGFTAPPSDTKQAIAWLKSLDNLTIEVVS
ncbi:MAG: ATP-binding cassette domain-containing protein [Corynebacterium sp.]|nr:ATP-binding cassette domain-containing protein [Corynebacterium sp.]